MAPRKRIQVAISCKPNLSPAAHCAISAVSHQGLTVTTPDGEPATLAIVNKDGKVIEAGPSVARQAWEVAIESYRNFLKGEGYLRVHSKPPESTKQ